jgi:hypothetical protein
MKAIGTILIAASLDLLILTQTCNTLDTFVGPGVIECNRGQCEFACPHSRRSCSDPCHTITRSSNLFTLSFRQVADVSGIQTYGGKQCYFKFAENINSHFPDEYVEIARGCTAKCDGCVFAPTVLFRKSCSFLGRHAYYTCYHEACKLIF